MGFQRSSVASRAQLSGARKGGGEEKTAGLPPAALVGLSVNRGLAPEREGRKRVPMLLDLSEILGQAISGLQLSRCVGAGNIHIRVPRPQDLS